MSSSATAAASTGLPEPDGVRVPAVASPIEMDVASIRMTVSITILTPPNGAGTVRFEAPHGVFGARSCFAVRYYVHGVARRAMMQAQRVVQLSGVRDVVKAKMLSDVAAAPLRAATRQRVAATVHGEVVESANGLAPGTEVVVAVIDASRGGVGFDCDQSLVEGDVIVLHVPSSRGHVGVELELVRVEHGAATPFAATYRRPIDGETLFAVLVAAFWAERSDAARRRGDGHDGEPGAQGASGRSRGMATRKGEG